MHNKKGSHFAISLWVPSQYEDGLNRYGIHIINIRRSYLYNGNPYPDNTSYLYWEGPQVW